jgi:hypothetical protein
MSQEASARQSVQLERIPGSGCQLHAGQIGMLQIDALALEVLLDGDLLVVIIPHLHVGGPLARDGFDLEAAALSGLSSAEDGSRDRDAFEEAVPVDASVVLQAGQSRQIAQMRELHRYHV